MVANQPLHLELISALEPVKILVTRVMAWYVGKEAPKQKLHGRLRRCCILIIPLFSFLEGKECFREGGNVKDLIISQ